MLAVTTLAWLPVRHTTAQVSHLRSEVEQAMKHAAQYFRGELEVHGGYVYFYSEDLQVRWGEGVASPDQIWVQPPGTPTVGLAFVNAYEATGDPYYRTAFLAQVEALLYGQLKSGGWTNCVDFDPTGQRVADYRNGKGRGKNFSTLDDDTTQAALRFLMRADRATRFEQEDLHRSVQIALGSMLDAQFPNGAFPQGWTEPVSQEQSAELMTRRASYPDYDWRREGRIKEYWDQYTLNDDAAGSIVATLVLAYEIYAEDRFLGAIRRFGDFLILAQMPLPQPAWAQQYSAEMKPIWARKFEPPAIAGRESEDVMEALMTIYRVTDEPKYLAPIPRALTYLSESLLPDGRLARYYELTTNRPLYMKRNRDVYTLTYDDSRLPSHYGWKVEARLEEIDAAYQRCLSCLPENHGDDEATGIDLETRAAKIVDQLDAKSRWIVRYDGERLVGQPKFQMGAPYISSERFSDNMNRLSDFVKSLKTQQP